MKNKLKYIYIIIWIILVGLISRNIDFIPLVIWDILWAMMIFYILLFITNLGLQKIVIVSLIICFFVELSQLINTELLNDIRNNNFWKLILWQWFLISDLIAYSIGISFLYFIQKFIIIKKALK